MESNRVTKRKLKDIILCNPSYWYRFIDGHWPWWRRKMSVLEIAQKGLDLGVLPRHLYHVVKSLDRKRMTEVYRSWPNISPPYETLKHYLWGDANVYS